MKRIELERQRQIRDSLRALWFTVNGRMPHRPSRLECTHSLDQRYATAFVTDPRDPGVRRPNLLAGVWHHGPGVSPELWLVPAVTPRWNQEDVA